MGLTGPMAIRGMATVATRRWPGIEDWEGNLIGSAPPFLSVETSGVCTD